MRYLLDLFQTKVFTVGRLTRLLAHVIRYGVQLSNVLHMPADRRMIAIRSGDTALSYKELFRSISAAGGYLFSTYHIRQRDRILVIADNSIPSIILIFALSSLGCHIHVIAPMKDRDQFKRTVGGNTFDFIFSAVREEYEYYDELGIHFLTPRWADVLTSKPYQPFVNHATNISFFTSGSTGIAKTAKRSNTLWQYVQAIADLVKTLQIFRYKSVMLPVPIYHSYGLSALFLSLMLGKTIHLVAKFETADFAREIQNNNVEVAILVPQMLSGLLSYDLKSLRCIVCCADVLPTTVLQAARENFGDVVFNLYGTSETGLATVATPSMLAVKPETIGRPINGCKLKLVEEKGEYVLHVMSGFAMNRGYIRTGDIAFCDENGWYYLRGRIDHLLVVNGTNIYPFELLEMVYKHEGIQHAEVRSFVNELGFRKIKLILQAKYSREVNEQQFKDWWARQYGTKFLPTIAEFEATGFRSKLM
jgi:fatty-acyl-CoA synthase